VTEKRCCDYVKWIRLWNQSLIIYYTLVHDIVYYRKKTILESYLTECIYSPLEYIFHLIDKNDKYLFCSFYVSYFSFWNFFLVGGVAGTCKIHFTVLSNAFCILFSLFVGYQASSCVTIEIIMVLKSLQIISMYLY